MKKLPLILGGFALGAAIMLMPCSSKATIVGSKHDFYASTNYWIGGTVKWMGSGSSTNVCGECHTIHHAPDAARGPLWIHTPTAQSMKLYNADNNSDTFPSTIPVILGSSSRTCLGCHDGTVAINSTDSETGGITTTTNKGGTAVYIAASGIPIEVSGGNDDLTHMHPIGVNYSACIGALPPNSLNPVGTAFNAPGSPRVIDVLKNGSLECASCHDIHRTLGSSTTSGIYTIASGQNLCLGCHNR